MATGLSAMYASAPYWLQYGTFVAPAIFSTGFNQPSTVSHHLSPLRDTSSFSIHRQYYIIILIATLLLRCSPSAIRGLVVTFFIGPSVKGMLLGRSASHYGQKLFKRRKQEADTLSAPSGVIFGTRHVASFLGSVISPIFWAIRFAVDNFTPLSALASARYGDATRQCNLANIFDGSAIAKTFPHRSWATLSSRIARKFYNSVSAKSLTYKVWKGMIRMSFFHNFQYTEGVR
jgi:hypothetical protein